MLRVDAEYNEKLIAPLFKTPRWFYPTVGILLLIFGFGVYMYIRQITIGLGETGMSRPTYWGIYMVNFIFFIGISHAGTLISAILRVMGAEWRRPITRVAEAVTAFALIVGTLQIIIDMGRPDRLAFTLLFGRVQSPILWDVISVTMYFLGSVTYLYLPLIPDAAILRDNCPPGAPAWQRKLYTILALGWRGTKSQWIRLEKSVSFMAVFIIPVAVSVHTIISWILATTVQPGWHSSIFGPYFVVGAIFSGIGALFIAMTSIRKAYGLENIIGLKQYRNLGMLFLTMNFTWMYFTYAEHIGVAAGQLTEEFPVLAAKLWGEFSGGFWFMFISMVISLFVLLVPRWVPERPVQSRIFQPRTGIAFSGGLLTMAGLMFGPNLAPGLTIWADLSGYQLAFTTPETRTLGWMLMIFLAVMAGLGFSRWLKHRLVVSTIIASVFVLIGMWLERWYIIVPTMTHPRLIPYTTYQPTLTELALTAGSFALFILLFLFFFRLFPAVSIWEIAEGKVIQEAQAKITIPPPEPSDVGKRLRRWGQKFYGG
jgi:molybdopterin-containing oxidoreductase family membrane subunit